MNFPKKSSKRQKSIVQLYVIQFGGEKTVFVNIYSLLLVKSKPFIYTNPNFPQDLSFFKYGKKNKCSKYFSALF